MNIEKLEKIATKLLTIPRVRILPRFGKPTGDGTSEYATFSARIIAMTLDMALIFMLLAPIFLGLSRLFFPDFDQVAIARRLPELVGSFVSGELTGMVFVNEVRALGLLQKLLFDYSFQGCVSGIIIVFFWHKYGRTPGMMLFRMHVVDATTHERPSLKQLVVRYATGAVSAIVCMIGFLWILFDKRNQALHDKIAHTLVLRTPFAFWKKKDTVVEEVADSAKSEESEESEESDKTDKTDK